MQPVARNQLRHMKRMAILLAKVGALEERNMQLTRKVEERRAVLKLKHLLKKRCKDLVNEKKRLLEAYIQLQGCVKTANDSIVTKKHNAQTVPSTVLDGTSREPC